MQRRIAVVVGLVSVVMAAAPAAWATAVPFNVDVPINPQGGEVGVHTNEDTGLIGACDVNSCTGFRVTEATTPVGFGTTAGRLWLSGVVCIRDLSSACTTNGVAFTGVKITNRYVDTPEGYVDPASVKVNFCLWLMSPQDQPYACDLPEITTDYLAIRDMGDMSNYVPQAVWGAF